MISKYIREIEVSAPGQLTATLNSGFRISTSKGLSELLYLLDEMLCPCNSQYCGLWEHETMRIGEDERTVA